MHKTRHSSRRRGWGVVRAIVVTAACCPGMSAVAAEDIVWEGGLTAVYQDTDDRRVSSEATLSADLTATWRAGRGAWFVYVEASTSTSSSGISAFYPTANADAGSVLTQDGNAGIQISELNYTFELPANRSLVIGLIDSSAWLDRGRIANDENQHFLNGSFVNNATIEFPDYTVGGVFRRAGYQFSPELVLVFASSDGIADLADRSYQDLLEVTSDERGVFAGAGASWLFERWSWRAGAWLRTDDHDVGPTATDTGMNYGAYGVIGWQHESNAFNLRMGLANPDVSIADRFIAVAYERQTRYGLFGVGVAKTAIADDFREAGRDDAYDAEAFFRIPVFGQSAHLTPSVQYIKNPGFDASSSTASESAVIVGLRFHWGF